MEAYMLLNIKNIETRPSINAGKSYHKHKLKIRIDKATLVSSFTNNKEKIKIHSALRNCNKSPNNKYAITHTKLKEGYPYKKAISIISREKIPSMLLHIAYSPVNKNTGSIRFDFRPQHVNDSEFKELIKWMESKFGKEILKIISRSWITQIDVALDIYDCKLKDYLWSLKNAGVSEYFHHRNGLPGLRLGSIRSKINILCYEKIYIRRKEFSSLQSENGLLGVKSKNHKYLLRVEARFKPKTILQGKKGKPLSLKEISSMDNPFLRLMIYSNQMQENLINKKYLPYKIKTNNAIVIKNKMKKSSKLSRHSLAVIEKNEIDLIDQNEIWGKWELCTRKFECLINKY
ncbi:hypothetical protein ACN5LY_001555 [Cronobacter dublinensis]|uniref:hypothetical protein n=1 Tax=Cronobacter dublinensis TaxID=413497 RepID=UPI0024B0005D|nr:hypothetical protein [Cronobacter dublinensis]MDI7505362.1 hypothetical protein [Cronobacter dublinensis]